MITNVDSDKAQSHRLKSSAEATGGSDNGITNLESAGALLQQERAPRAGTAASGVVPPRAGLHSNPPRLLHGWRACRVVAVRVAARTLCALLIDDVVLQLHRVLAKTSIRS